MTIDNAMEANMMDSHPVKPASPRRIRRRKRRVQRQPVSAGLLPSIGQEEVIVVDDRAHLRPAQIVESKLTRMLQEASVPVSHLLMRGLLKVR